MTQLIHKIVQTAIKVVVTKGLHVRHRIRSARKLGCDGGRCKLQHMRKWGFVVATNESA